MRIPSAQGSILSNPPPCACQKSRGRNVLRFQTATQPSTSLRRVSCASQDMEESGPRIERVSVGREGEDAELRNVASEDVRRCRLGCRNFGGDG